MRVSFTGCDVKAMMCQSISLPEIRLKLGRAVEWWWTSSPTASSREVALQKDRSPSLVVDGGTGSEFAKSVKDGESCLRKTTHLTSCTIHDLYVRIENLLRIEGQV
jgi:hypothetical protein